MTGPQFDNRRVLAAMIDLLLLVPVALVMSLLFGGFTAAAALLTWGWALYYYFALESDHGQTIGKRVMKLRVVRADGQPLDIGRVAVRTLLRPIDAIGAYLLGLVVMMATGQRRQRIGDLAAGTVVTDAAVEASEPEQAVEQAEPQAPEAPAAHVPPMPAPSEPMADTGLAPDVVPAMKPFEPFAEPTPAPEAEPEPAVEMGAPPVPDLPPLPELPPLEEIVPVDRPEDREPPTDEQVPVDEPTASSMEIVSSPIDLVMEDHDEEPKPPQA